MPQLKPILIIACGGKSERMGTDKCFIDYHGKPQYLYLQDLFEPHFSEIYFSIRKDQAPRFKLQNKTIIDIVDFENHGPISGLLSCAESFPDQNIHFIGCDYPLIKLEDVIRLSSDLSPDNSSAYYNEFYEPLLALYNNNCFDQLRSEFYDGNYSLQKFLNKISASKIVAEDKRRIKSIDTKEEYEEFISNISLERKKK